MHATRAAVEEGIVPAAASPTCAACPAGRSSRSKRRREVGVDIVRRALRSRCAGSWPRRLGRSIVVNKVREGAGDRLHAESGQSRTAQAG